MMPDRYLPTGGPRWRGSLTVLFLAMAVVMPATMAGTYHVAPGGDDTAAGTATAPWKSLQAATDRLHAGDTLLLHDGVFVLSRTLRLSGTAVAAEPRCLRAAPGARPVLCFEQWRPTDEKERAGARGVMIEGDSWRLEGLEICHAPDNGLKIEGSHNHVERCVFHHNGDSGLQIGLSKKTLNDGALAAHNAVVNCDSFRNVDTRTKGENADGFACKLFPGPGNRFVGCRAWENADDGWDLFMTTFPVTLDRCWAWHNGDPALIPAGGTTSGDGNGFKLGGQDKPASHLVRRCVAFDHPFGSGNGFEDNNNTAPITLQHCTAWGNKTNFHFKKAAHIVQNSASFDPTKSRAGVAFDVDVICQHNTWSPDPKKPGKYLPAGTRDDFEELDAALAVAARGPDGDLPDNGFASPLPRPASGVIDQGLDIGLPFIGAAPDIGAVEFDPEAHSSRSGR